MTVNRGRLIALEGLDGSETYIVEGLLRARPGMPVTPETLSDTPEQAARSAPAAAQPEANGEAEEQTEPASEDG